MNPLVHLELHTADGPGAGAFYRELCGWEPQPIETRHGSYVSLDLGRCGGGIVECGTTRSLWLPYVEVESVDRATRLARSLGARVMLAPREGPAGWRSVVTTPTGGELAFWEPKRCEVSP